jgi:DNA (cytosine-5)-methyltransferase 1
VIDLFSGTGGLSWGLSQHGFEVLAGIDHWTAALKTFKHNHKNARVFDTDIEELPPKTLLKELGLKAGELDVLVGGPPCQGFSKNTPASARFFDDPRNLLFRYFMEYVRVIQPKVVVMENVAEIFNAYEGSVRNEIVGKFKDYGYSVDVRVLNAADFGIPQKRRRCFFFAVRGTAVPTFPTPTHGKPKNDGLFSDILPFVTAWEAIQDLPKPKATDDLVKYTKQPKTDFQSWIRGSAESVANHKLKVLSPIQQQRYDSLQPGQGIKDLPAAIRPKGGYSGAYGRLDESCLAPTITRWVFHPGSGRYGHPVESRIITMREAARLQSFSDDFEFIGSINDIAGQIGNAVPPRFMAAFAPIILKVLKSF